MAKPNEIRFMLFFYELGCHGNRVPTISAAWKVQGNDHNQYGDVINYTLSDDLVENDPVLDGIIAEAAKGFNAQLETEKARTLALTDIDVPTIEQISGKLKLSYSNPLLTG